MEKEIFDNLQVISQVLGFYLNASEEKLTLPTLPEVTAFKRIVLIGVVEQHSTLVWLQSIGLKNCAGYRLMQS